MPNIEVKRLHVAVGVITDGDKVLIALRPDTSHMGGLWEFPGGKVEQGEMVEAALARELREEVAITVQQCQPLLKISHNYPDKSVLLDVWRVTAFNGLAQGLEGQQIRWVAIAELTDYQFPLANKQIVDILQRKA